ncbi:MAG: hypothetical protein LBR71_05440 [Synergistaceae bacterium]|jgi:hypothetical protein|nr:hypothetical protein [Synergistaceae bacterium]
MTTAAQTREPEMGLTFEKVWAMFQESDRRMQKLSEETAQQMRETDRKMREESDRRMQKLSEETNQKMQETAQQMRETDRKMQETAQQMRETDRKIQEVSQQIRESNEETNRKMKETNKHIGELGNRFGELAEHLVAASIVEKFNALGFHFNDISAGPREIILDENRQITAEFDILLENGESSVAVEVKSKPSERDVKDHVRRLGILRRHKDRTGDKRKIFGALAGAIMLPGIKASVIKAGLYAITQTGDTVKIDVPEGFTPKTW